jgi:non-ribosomal peptide synthetase component F
MAQIQLMTPEQEQHMMSKVNDTACDVPQKCVHEQIEQRVQENPTKVAVKYEGSSLTYAELWRKSKELAVYLQGLGVGPETYVGVMVSI